MNPMVVIGEGRVIKLCVCIASLSKPQCVLYDLSCDQFGFCFELDVTINRFWFRD